MGDVLSRLEELEREISRRLRRVCGHMPPEQFDRLVRAVAMRTLKFELAPEHFLAVEAAVKDGRRPYMPD